MLVFGAWVFIDPVCEKFLSVDPSYRAEVKGIQAREVFEDYNVEMIIGSTWNLGHRFLFC
jgi:hypothetical protein